MTYDPNIPQDLPSPSTIVSKIRLNFSEFANVFDNNHAALNTSNQGKHTNVIFQEQSEDPEVVGGFDSLYGKSVVSNSSTSDQVFARIPKFLPNDQPNNPMQLTCTTVNNSGPIYQSFLPGGYLFFFGQTSDITNPITLSPAPSEILCVISNTAMFDQFNNPFDCVVTVNNNFQFKIDSFAVNEGLSPYLFTWIAIGKQ